MCVAYDGCMLSVCDMCVVSCFSYVDYELS